MYNILNYRHSMYNRTFLVVRQTLKELSSMVRKHFWFLNILPCILKILWMCFTVAMSVDEWKFSVCKDVPQQEN